MAKDTESKAPPKFERPAGVARTRREKLLSAAKALALNVTDSWDDDRLAAEVRKANTGANKAF